MNPAPLTQAQIRSCARWIALVVLLQPRARRRQLIAAIREADAAMTRRPEVTPQ